MSDNKGTVTIFIPNNITKEEIKTIRKEFKKDPANKNYKLNIIISGTENPKFNLINFLKAML